MAAFLRRGFEHLASIVEAAAVVERVEIPLSN
jgi:hypothetical protein